VPGVEVEQFAPICGARGEQVQLEKGRKRKIKKKKITWRREKAHVNKDNNPSSPLIKGPNRQTRSVLKTGAPPGQNNLARAK